MGLKCRIGRKADGTLLVTNENGFPSSLYQQALAYTKNEKDALEMWAVASTPDFVESIGKKGTVDDVSLESVIQYYNSNKKLIGTLTPSETFEVKQMMADHNVGRLSEMAAKLKEIFYEGNIPNFYPEKAIKSGLFTSEDVKNIDLARIGDLIMRMEADALVNDFSIETSTPSSGYRNPSVRNIFGASEVIPMEAVYQEVIAAVENPQSEQEIRQAVQELPYTDLVTKFNEDEAFAEKFISRFKNIRKIPNVEERDGELVADVTDTFSTIKNTISTDFDQLDIEAEILYIENIPANIWEESKEDVAEVIKEIESDFADKNIDIVGLSEVTTDQATILRVLNAVNDMVKNPTNQKIQAFSDVYDGVFGKTATKSVEKLPKELDGLTIVRMHSEKSDQQLFERHGLIKVGDGLYHKIRTTDSLTDLYEAVYQQVKNGLVEIPERFNLTKDVNQKENTLKDIEKFINSRKTGLDFYNERASLYQVIFGHPTMDNTRKINEDIRALAGVVTNVDYLKAGFISDFYNYILKEKLKNSAVYRNTLSKIGINSRDITIGNDISDLKNIEYYEELMDYLALKKDSTGKKYIAKEFKQDATNVLTVINFPETVGEYNGVKNIVGNLMSIPRTVNNFVRIGDTLYQKVGENPQTSVFVKVRPSTDNLYYQTEVETESYTKEQVEQMKKQDMAALSQLTPEDIEQRNQKNGSLSKFVQAVKQKSIEYAKKVQANFQTSNKTAESKSDIKFEQNLIEFIKQKGINVIADSKVFADKIKEMGFNSLNAMVQAWHGSPYSFDQFLTEKIGTGEGNQSFGWGLYFTDLKSIAKGYAEKLSTPKMMLYGEDILSGVSDVDAQELLEYLKLPTAESKRRVFSNKATDEEEVYFEKEGGVWFRYRTEIVDESEEDDYEYVPRTSKRKLRVEDVLSEKIRVPEFDIIISKEIGENLFNKVINNISNIKIENNKSLYRVSIHQGKTPDQYTWLEWDKEISEKQIKDLLNNNIEGDIIEALTYYFSEMYDINTTNDLVETLKDQAITGRKLYRILEKNIGENPSARDTSLALLRAGIDGIKYPAESISRGATSDTARGFNYVVFDESAITIEEKIQFLQTPQGDILGFEKNGSIYLDPTKINNTTTLHELIHVFQQVLDIRASKGDKQAQSILQKRKDLFQNEATFWKEYHKFNVAPKGAIQAQIAGDNNVVEDIKAINKIISIHSERIEDAKFQLRRVADGTAKTRKEAIVKDIQNRLSSIGEEIDITQAIRIAEDPEISGTTDVDTLLDFISESKKILEEADENLVNLKIMVALPKVKEDLRSATSKEALEPIKNIVNKILSDNFQGKKEGVELLEKMYPNTFLFQTMTTSPAGSVLSELGLDLSSPVYAKSPGESDVDYNNRMLREVEAFITAPKIAEKLENLRNENPSLWQQIMDFITNLKAWLKTQIGLSDYQGDILSMTKEEYIDALGVSVLKDEYKPLNKSQAIQRNNGNPLNLAPNGKPSNLYKAYKDLGYSDTDTEGLVAQVYTDQFIEWFGDWINSPEDASKVVDENGQPLVVFHGTNNTFTEFSKDLLGSENWLAESAYMGFFFAGNQDTSKAYTGFNMFEMNLKYPNLIKEVEETLPDTQIKEKIKIKQEKQNDYVVERLTKTKEDLLKSGMDNNTADFLTKMYNSSFYDQYSKEAFEKIKDESIKQDSEKLQKNRNDLLLKLYKDRVDSSFNPNILNIFLNIRKPYVFDFKDSEERGLPYHIQQAKESQNDGVIFENLKDGAEEDSIYVVFEPNQIKSATDNVGAFSKETNNINFQVSPIQPSLQKIQNDIMLKQMALDSRIEILILPSEQEEQDLLDKMDSCGL